MPVVRERVPLLVILVIFALMSHTQQSATFAKAGTVFNRVDGVSLC